MENNIRIFPKDCLGCVNYICYDMSVDDCTNICKVNNMQIDDCDIVNYIKYECPLDKIKK